MAGLNLTKIIIRWLLLVVILLYGISGFGITEYRIVEPATLGLLTRNLAFKIHDNLVVPMVVLLVLHVCFPYITKRIKRLSAASSSGN